MQKENKIGYEKRGIQKNRWRTTKRNDGVMDIVDGILVINIYDGKINYVWFTKYLKLIL